MPDTDSLPRSILLSPHPPGLARPAQSEASKFEREGKQSLNPLSCGSVFQQYLFFQSLERDLGFFCEEESRVACTKKRGQGVTRGRKDVGKNKSWERFFFFKKEQFQITSLA